MDESSGEVDTIFKLQSSNLMYLQRKVKQYRCNETRNRLHINKFTSHIQMLTIKVKSMNDQINKLDTTITQYRAACNRCSNSYETKKQNVHLKDPALLFF